MYIFLDMKNNFPNFAQDFDDDPTALANSFYADVDTDDDDDDIGGALAFTDFTKLMPVLEGEDAERFIRNMEEAERRAEERAKRPKTKEEIESELSIKRMLLEFQERELENLKKDIKKLEELHAKTEEE